MNILIVGANSKLSQELIALLNKSGSHSIYGLCNINTNNLKEEAHYLKLDELKLLNPQIDLIYYIASYIPYGNWDEISTPLIDTNIRLLLDISALCPESHMVYCSSVSVYGQKQKDEAIKENSELAPSNAYAISKLAGEIIAYTHPSAHVLRISSIYGKGIQTPTFIPRAVEQALKKNKILIYGDGSRQQNYVHIKDLARMLFNCQKLKGKEILLAVSSRSYSNLEVAKIIAEKTGAEIEFTGSDSSNSSIFDAVHSRKILACAEDIPIEEAIQEILDGR